MRVLITGARAPACLEWARLLRKTGCAIAVADSVAVPLARFSACVDRWFRLPAPTQDVNAYGEALLAAARSFQADCILPTCEEAFYIAHQKRRLEQHCRIIVADFDLMARLHDKAAFAEFSQNLPLSAPPTVRLQAAEELWLQAGRSRQLVFKPVFSRFAAQTLIRPESDKLRGIQVGADKPWIAQQFMEGRELCSYSLLHEGRVLAHSCYHPKFRVGQGSGIYLEPVASSPIRNYLQAFGSATGYSGQVGFDFIESAEGDLSVLECNPRATSGIHLFHNQALELASLLQSPQNSSHIPGKAAVTNTLPSPAEPGGEGGEKRVPACGRRARGQHSRENEAILNANGGPRMVSVAMLLFAAPRIRNLAAMREFAGAWRSASDILWSFQDSMPVFTQMLGLGEIYYRAIKLGCPPLAAATQDIEWNGQSLGPQP